MEIPLLPSYRLPTKAEAGAQGLLYFQRRECVAEFAEGRQIIHSGIFRYRHHAFIDHPQQAAEAIGLIRRQ